MLQVQRKRSFSCGGTQSNCFPLNFKRPKVYAVRDFPRDCGTFSSGVTTSSSKVVSGEAASPVSEVQLVHALRKLPMDCGPLRTRVIKRSSSRKTVDDEASFHTSKVQRVDEIEKYSTDCGSFPNQVAGRPRKDDSDEPATGMSKVGQEEVLVPERTLEIISPIGDNKLKPTELVLSGEEANPLHQGDDGNVFLKTLNKSILDNEPDEKLALVEANKASAIMKTVLRPQPPARLYPLPKIRKGLLVVRDFPPGCGGLACASRSEDKLEDRLSKETAGEVKCTQAQVQRSSDLKLILGRDDRRSLSPQEKNVSLDSPQVSSDKIEEDMVDRPEKVHEQLFDESNPEDETGIQVWGSSGLKVVPGGVDSRAPSPSQKKWSPNSAQVVSAKMEENLVGEREKKQLATEALKPNYWKQTSFTASAEDAGRVEDDKEQCDHCYFPRVSNDISIPSSDCKNNTDNKYTVREALDQFRVVFEKISVEPEPQLKKNMKTVKQVHVEAAIILKKQQRWVNTTKLLGHVPGIEVGDQFRFRAELVVVGLHRQFQAGIDYMMKDGLLFATSIVDSGRYANEAESSDVLVYSGAGGNPSPATNKKPEDQKLEGGNIALKNSMDSQMPVRVIRGCQNLKSSNNREWTPMYMYDGLYNVISYKQEIGRYRKLVFMFKLYRLPGQPKINWETVKVSKMSKVCKVHSVVDDISQGKEKIPIPVINSLDDEKPLPFHYMTKVLCLKPRNRSLPVGCDCTNGCSEMKSCLCILKNGGEIPFADSGAIITEKPLVYECGPSCKCPPSCKNRVSQHGVRYQLEVFKTKSVGWGVRSRNYISAGSFICEYVGELLQDKEAELRRYDDYLFDVGCGRENLEVSSDNGYTIDAAHCGNVGRFLNHSCSPNLYAQNVLYDHLNKQFPHIMFFAAENIPPLHELTFDYNYKLDSIRDEDGSIKKKNCYCGSTECRGRMY